MRLEIYFIFLESSLICGMKFCLYHFSLKSTHLTKDIRIQYKTFNSQYQLQNISTSEDKVNKVNWSTTERYIFLLEGT